MSTLPAGFRPYAWAPSTEELAVRAGLDPVEIIRFDGNVPALPLPSSRPGAIAGALAEINMYPHGGYPGIDEAIAAYAGVAPECVVLGAGADDLLLLCGRAFARPGDTVAIPAEPTYPLFRVAAELAGATVGDEAPVLTFCCRPGNPYGDLPELPSARPLVVDEAYFEYSGGETAVGLIDEGVVVVRTFSKAFALAGARIGYLLAEPELAAELRARQSPAQVSTLSVALALAALRSPPDVGPVLEERERLTAELRALGFEPLPSRANFVFVSSAEPERIYDELLAAGCVVRLSRGGFRITVRDREDDDVLLGTLAGARGHFTFAGTPEQVADLIEDWFTDGAADGFNIMPPFLPGGLDDFVDLVGDVSRGFVAVNGDLRSGYAGWTGQNSPLFLGLRMANA